MEKLRIIGVSTSIAMDGIKAAVVTIDGNDDYEFEATFSIDYSDLAKTLLRRIVGKDYDNSECIRAEELITINSADIIFKILNKSHLQPSDIDYISISGQTITHLGKKTVQLTNANLLAKLTGIPVIYDYCKQDVENGGSGFPLTSVFFKSLVNKIPKPIGVLHIAGVSNLHYFDKSNNAIAFNAGPNNPLLTYWLNSEFDEKYIGYKNINQIGEVNNEILNEILNDSYFSKPYPKSLGRNSFNYIKPQINKLSSDVKVATLAQITVDTIIKSIELLPSKPDTWIICNEFKNNEIVIGELKSKLNGNVYHAKQLGWNSGFIEAQAFAYLGARFINKQPVVLPSVTGVRKDSIAAKIATIDY